MKITVKMKKKKKVIFSVIMDVYSIPTRLLSKAKSNSFLTILTRKKQYSTEKYKFKYYKFKQ